MASHSDTKELTQEKGETDGKDIKKKRKSTPFLDKLPFDKDLKFSNDDFKADDNITINQKLHEELKKAGKPKFLERSAFPDDKVLVQLARRVYEETDTGKELADLEMPEGWWLLTTAFNQHISNGYFGAAYWNPEQQQIVVAHRGTDKKNIGSIWADIRGILKNNYVPQMNSAITFAHKIKVIVEELNKRDDVFLQLSFTGHSLGGWLAQITTLTTKYFSTIKRNNKLYFLKIETIGYHAHTVVFDSPGCEEMLSKIIDNFDLRYVKNHNSFEINDLDITIYLVAPNLVNTCKRHIGSLYRVFTHDPPPRGSLNFGNYTLKVHGIQGIKEVFFSDKIKETQKVTDWPLVLGGITKRAIEMISDTIIDALDNPTKRLLLITILNLFTISIIKVLLSTILYLIAYKKIKFQGKDGGILPSTNEYEYFHLLAEEVKDYNPEPDDVDGYCIIRYQLEKVDKTTCSTAIFSQPELDFLNQYKILRDNPVKKLKDVLKQLGDEAQKMKDTFKNFNVDAGGKVIRCKSEDILKTLIRYVKYIIHFTPEITDRIERILRDDPVWFRVENLKEPFIGRTKELEQLHTYFLRRKGIAIPVITGLEGVGKSELTLEYVREYYGKDNSIIWINAENEEALKSSFMRLHEKLDLKSRYKDGEVNTELIINDVYKYLTANIGSSIFIRCESEDEFKKLIRCVKYVIHSSEITDRLERILRDDPVWFRVDELDEPFIERTNELEQLHIHIIRGEGIATAVITGSEGVGKSELTLKYVREYYGKDNSIIWTNAENEEALKSSFMQLHEQLDLKSRYKDGEVNMELIINDVYKYLTANIGSSIFIFDNTKNYAAIEKFLPKGLYEYNKKVHVVIITTISNSLEWKSKIKSIEVLNLNEFNDEEAKKFVKDSLEITNDLQDTDITELIKKMCKLPLALQQAVIYIKEMKKDCKDWNIEYKISDYLEAYQKEISGSDELCNGVLLNLNIKIGKIAANETFSKDTLDILDIISYFAPTNIPGEIFVHKFKNIYKLILITKPLIKYSIVSVEKGMLKVSELQQLRKLKVEEEEREEKTLREALRLLTEHIALSEHCENKSEAEKKEREKKEREKKEREKKEREKIKLCTPHVVSVWNHAYKYPKLIEEFLIGGKNIKISETDLLSVPYFNFIAAGSEYGIVKKIIDEIEKKAREKTGTSETGKIVIGFINRKNKDMDKERALHCAVKSGKKQTVELLVSKGADVNAKKKYGWTPLILAVFHGHQSIVEYLLNNDQVKIGMQRTGRGYTELHFASRNGNVEMVTLLLRKSADLSIPQKSADKKTSEEVLYVNAKDMRQYTALHFAVKRNYLEIIKLLLKDARIDVNAKTEWGLTPLHFAVKARNPVSVELLLDGGADVNAKKQPDNFTPLHLAVLDGNKEIITYLLDRKEIKINDQTTEGNTALHLVAKKGNLEVVEILIQKGANSTIENNDDKLASDLADENKYTEVKTYIDKNSKEFSNELYDQVK